MMIMEKNTYNGISVSKLGTSLVIPSGSQRIYGKPCA
jgi:hypothetical protein